MPASSRLNGFFKTKDSKKARDFYEGVLGLTFERENEYVIVFRTNQYAVVGQKVEEFTPEPSTIGRTESHGCIRLTNWDATKLGRLVSVGTKVTIQ